MYIYIITLMISLLFASVLMEVKKFSGDSVEIFGVNIRKKYIEYALLLLSMAPIIALSGFRYSVGVDYFYTYTKTYDYVAQGLTFTEVSYKQNCEIGFYLLVKAIVTMGGGYVWMFLISSAIIVGLFWIGFYQQSDNLCLSITLFFCAESFFVSLAYVRQFIAAAIVFYGMKYLGKKGIKDNIKFILCVAVAYTFHRSVLIMLPFVIAPYIRLHPVFLSGAIAVFSVLKDKFSMILESLLSHTLYSYYIGTVYQSSSRFYFTRPIAFITVFILASLLYRKCKNDKKYIMLLNVAAALVLITVNFDIIPQLDRVTWYFEIIMMLIVPYILERIENVWLKKIVTIGVLVMFSIFTYHNVVVCLYHGVTPYRLVFAPDMVFH